jgi:hypothetical protein
MQEPGNQQKRINIPFFEGVNSLVSFNIGKKTELVHAENARSVIIGTIEKRGGQTVLGLNSNNKPFVTTSNYGLFSFQNIGNRGFYRISGAENSDLSINISETLFLTDTMSIGNTSMVNYQIGVIDNINLTEQVNENTNNIVTIYYINSSNQWIPLTGNGSNIPGGVFDYTYAEGNVFLVNFNSNNRYIQEDGVTTVDSTNGSGHLFNTPAASRINFYKNRLYLADFVRDGIRYKTTILRSSYPMGIIALVNNDITITMDNGGLGSSSFGNIRVSDTISFSEQVFGVDSSVASGLTGISTSLTATSIEITDKKYFYTNSGANSYDVYRGTTLIAQLVVTKINETSIEANVTAVGTMTSLNLLSSDEIWISGTYTGKKIFRWVNNPSITGRDVKQYDTFKLSGGENDEITMLTNIGNIMMVSNRNAISTWNDYTLENFDLDVGCVSKKGYVKMLGTLYFLHYTGVYATSGGIPKLISNKIERYITGATRTGKEMSASGKKGRNVFFTLGDVTLYKNDGSVDKILNDVCIEYNITQENWFIHTNVKANEFATFIEELDSDRLEFTDTSGNKSVKEFLSGETDDGKEINFRIDTIKLTMQSNFEYSANPIAIISEVERGSSIRSFVNLENNQEFYPLEGKITKGLSIVKINNKDDDRGKPPLARLISISLRDSSKQLCKVSRMSLIYLPTTSEVVDNES